VETWQFQGASLVAVPGDYAVLAGQVGTLNGYFDYDTTTHSITAFEFTAGPALFSSNNSQVAFCPIGTCTGNALVPAPNKLVFDEELTPATNQRLELHLSEPLDTAGTSVLIDPASVILYNYGYAQIQVVGGSLVRATLPAFNAPEPSGVAQLLCGLGVTVLISQLRRASARPPTAPDQTNYRLASSANR